MLKRSRIHHWSCSKLANTIRGIEKPYALGWDEWETWRKEAEKKYPYRYWIAEKFLNKIQDIVCFPGDLLHAIKVYTRNRYFDKLQYLKTDLKPGEYYDLDTRILHGLFNELVIYVESELGHTMKAYKDRKYKFVKGRCKQAGLDHLDWAMNLNMNEDYGVNPGDEDYGKPTEQAITAKEVFELYNWWVGRENRPNPYELFTKEKDGKHYYKKIGDMEDSYYEEDTNMLVRLVKIRNSLWT